MPKPAKGGGSFARMSRAGPSIWRTALGSQSEEAAVGLLFDGLRAMLDTIAPNELFSGECTSDGKALKITKGDEATVYTRDFDSSPSGKAVDVEVGQVRWEHFENM